jgi:hypothetical protein
LVLFRVTGRLGEFSGLIVLDDGRCFSLDDLAVERAHADIVEFADRHQINRDRVFHRHHRFGEAQIN